MIEYFAGGAGAGAPQSSRLPGGSNGKDEPKPVAIEPEEVAVEVEEEKNVSEVKETQENVDDVEG